MNYHSFPILDKKLASEKYQKIIDAAIKVFAKKGFFNAKVADVAKQAEVADGTIYLYFKNKDDLLISIFEHSMAYFLYEAKRELAELTCPNEKLKRFIALHLTLVEQNQHLATVLQIELRSSHKFMKEHKLDTFLSYLSLIGEILTAGKKSGVFRADLDEAIASRALFGIIDEIALEWMMMNPKRYSLEYAAEQIYKLMIVGADGVVPSKV